MHVKSGSYVGTGSAHSPVTTLSFTPKVLIIKGGANSSVWRTDTMPTDSAKEAVQASVLQTGRITALNSNGFSVGTNAQTNNSGTTYHWLALGDDGSADIETGSYQGDGTDDRNITLSTLSGTPNLVQILPDATEIAEWRTSDMTALNSQSLNSALRTNRIQAFASGSFQVGNDSSVNNATGTPTYHWWAAKNAANLFKVFTYAGNGSDDVTQTGAGFQPHNAWTKRSNATTRAAIRFKDQVGDLSFEVDATNAAADKIQAFTSDGFQTGTSLTVNAASATYYAAAFKDTESINITPSAVAVPIVIPSPTVAVHRTISPSPLAIPIVIPVPVVTLSLTLISPTPVAIPIVIPTPAITINLYQAYRDLTRLLNPTDWGGTPTLILEIHAFTSSAGSPIKAHLYNVTDNAIVSGSTISSTNTVLDRLRSGAFSLAAGSKEYEVRYGGVAGATYTIEDAVLIVSP